MTYSPTRITRNPQFSSLQVVDAGLWQNLQHAGLESFELFRTQTGWLLRGAIVVNAATGSAEARYQIECDSNWRTQQADISVRDSSGDHHVHITRQNGTWYEDGNENKAVAGAIDIDLGWTPSTNTLPIRRLNLAIGEPSGPVTAAWISFPDLTLQPLRQEYRRLGKDRYLYTSQEGTFKAEIVVNDYGMVLDYENFWRRVGKGRTGFRE